MLTEEREAAMVVHETSSKLQVVYLYDASLSTFVGVRRNKPMPLGRHTEVRGFSVDQVVEEMHIPGRLLMFYPHQGNLIVREGDEEKASGHRALLPSRPWCTLTPEWARKANRGWELPEELAWGYLPEKVRALGKRFENVRRHPPAKRMSVKHPVPSISRIPNEDVRALRGPQQNRTRQKQAEDEPRRTKTGKADETSKTKTGNKGDG